MTKSMPHIKSYCRYSERGMYWFCLTSANMSKSAWGSFNSTNKLEAILRVNNYEVGVLWLPRVVVSLHVEYQIGNFANLIETNLVTQTNIPDESSSTN